jgi:hypothetical protein
MAVYFVFIDGIGIGESGNQNPFSKHNFPNLNTLWGDQILCSSSESFSAPGHLYKAVDANLGVEGLPQSGTGQTALFTGVNVSEEIGKHFGPFPHSACKPYLKENSLFKDLISRDKKPHFINAYPDRFFEFAERRNRWSCSTLMVKSAGLHLNRIEDVRKGRALTAEIMQDYWREKISVDVPEITAREAGERFYRVGQHNDLTLFEYYLTDKAGHDQKMDKAVDVLTRLDGFLKGFFAQAEFDHDTLIVSSDHGNLEDLSTKTHTRNPVPLVVMGRNAEQFNVCQSILDVKEVILEIV